MLNTFRALSVFALSAAAVQLYGDPFPPLTATLEQTTQSVGGTAVTTTFRFYRDNQGRTRLESGNRVQIQDPVAAVATTFDLDNSVAYVSKLVSAASTGAPSQAQKSPTSNGKILKPWVDNVVNLGSRVIDGNTVIGERHSVEYPPGTQASIRFTRVTTERWLSVDLGLPVLTKISDSRNGETTTYYRNIVKSPSIDVSLFHQPSGFFTRAR